MRAAGSARLLALLVGLGAAASGASGCSQSCCTVDSFPIALERAPLGAPPLPTASVGDGGAAPDGGALVAIAGLPNAPAGMTFPMVIDTGSPFTILAGPPDVSAATSAGSWNLYGTSTPDAPPLRAKFRGWDIIAAPLYPAGDPTFLPQGVLGANLLRGYSIEFRFGALCPGGGPALCSSMTFWNHLGEDASLLEDAGYAVVNFTAFGGGGDHRRRRSRLPRPARPARRPAHPGGAAGLRGPGRVLSGDRLAAAFAGELHQRPGGVHAGERRRPVADDRHRRRPPGPERVRLGARRRGRRPGAAHAHHAAVAASDSPDACAPGALRRHLVEADRRAALGDHPALRPHQPRGRGRQQSRTLRRARKVSAHGDRLLPEPDGHRPRPGPLRRSV